MHQIEVNKAIGLCCLFLAVATTLTSCGKPKPPLETDYRESRVGAGYVWVFRNTSSKDLTIDVHFGRPTTLWYKTLDSGTMTIPANGEREIGWMEGVELQQGDWVKVDHPDYAFYEDRIPKSFDH